MLIAISAACLGVGYALNLNDTQWILMAILLLAMLGYGIVGFVDDVRKVYRGTGISEIQKFIGVTLVSLLAAIAFNRLIVEDKLTARLAYAPYFDTPFIGHFLVISTSPGSSSSCCSRLPSPVARRSQWTSPTA